MSMSAIAMNRRMSAPVFPSFSPNTDVVGEGLPGGGVNCEGSTLGDSLGVGDSDGVSEGVGVGDSDGVSLGLGDGLGVDSAS